MCVCVSCHAKVEPLSYFSASGKSMEKPLSWNNDLVGASCVHEFPNMLKWFYWGVALDILNYKNENKCHNCSFPLPVTQKF